MARIREYIGNPDENHCLQASFMMVVDTALSRRLTWSESETLTGYVPERGTWQFQMLLAFADMGFNAVDHERFDAELFVRDPEAAIRQQIGDDEDTIQAVLDDTDLEAEAKRVRACLESPRVEFRNSVPTLEDMQGALADDAYVLATVNSRQFHGRGDGYEGHLVVIESLDGMVRMKDPFEGVGELAVPVGDFINAWHSPSESMANFIAVWPPVDPERSQDGLR